LVCCVFLFILLKVSSNSVVTFFLNLGYLGVCFEFPHIF
jgi:hypothetical protein